MIYLRDLVNGKVVSWGSHHIVIRKNSRIFRIEFAAFTIRELKSRCEGVIHWQV
jgi:hypothetical protein